MEKRLYTKGWNIQRLQSNNINSRAKNQNETFFSEGEPINDSAYTTNDLAMVSNPDQQTETIANIDEYNTLKIHSISLNNFNSSTSKLAKEVKENY
ncbi:MAG TPA: hypothetical protein VKZ44_10090, partial [Taishania sp.]|nr:hypothetical protein [Taishania sp.]